MNLFFTNIRTYHADEPLADVLSRVHSLASRKWSDFSVNLRVRSHDGGHLTFTPLYSFMGASGIDREPAHVRADFLENGAQAIVTLRIRPNAGLVVAFYCFMIFFFYTLFTGFFWRTSGALGYLFVCPLMLLLLYLWMSWLKRGLRTRVERFLNLTV